MDSSEKKWIDAILNSTNGMNRAEPNPFLFAKIQRRLANESRPAVTRVPARTVWLVAGSFAFLVILNTQLIRQRLAQPQTESTTELSAVVADMQLYPAQNQLYTSWPQ
jgi:NAD dependent epimerase/dehydratase family enzyme